MATNVGLAAAHGGRNGSIWACNAAVAAANSASSCVVAVLPEAMASRGLERLAVASA